MRPTINSSIWTRPIGINNLIILSNFMPEPEQHMPLRKKKWQADKKIKMLIHRLEIILFWSAIL